MSVQNKKESNTVLLCITLLIVVVLIIAASVKFFHWEEQKPVRKIDDKINTLIVKEQTNSDTYDQDKKAILTDIKNLQVLIESRKTTDGQLSDNDRELNDTLVILQQKLNEQSIEHDRKMVKLVETKGTENNK